MLTIKKYIRFKRNRNFHVNNKAMERFGECEEIDEDGERIPLTIADFDRETGNFTLVW
jgi:hypothetical protein